VRAAVEPRAAGEEAVTVRDVHDVVLGAAYRGDRARAAVVPGVDVMLCIEGDDALAGRSARGLDAHALGERFAEQAVWVGLAQVVFADEWQFVEVVQTFDVLGLHSVFVHFSAVVGRVLIGVLDCLYKSFALPFFDLFA